MDNNDVLRRIRYIFDIDDSKMIEIFHLAELETTRAEISNWLKKDDDPDFVKLPDQLLAVFLNGFINLKRGKRDGPQQKPEEFLNNNIIFRKLKIALNLKDIEVLELLELAEMYISKHELSAFFRKPSQRQYRPCKDQILRKFLLGLNFKYRQKEP